MLKAEGEEVTGGRRWNQEIGNLKLKIGTGWKSEPDWQYPYRYIYKTEEERCLSD